MKKIIQLLTISTILAFSTSCLIQINGSFQGLVSYYDETKTAGKVNFIPIKQSHEYCSIENLDSTIYIMNGNDLQKCIQSYNKTLVYIWSPNCSGKACYALDLLQHHCDKNDLELFVVAEYYDTKKMSISYNIEHPIVGIDTEHYQTNFTSKYLPKFYEDLTNKAILKKNDDDTIGRFFYFSNGQFDTTAVDIEKNEVPDISLE